MGGVKVGNVHMAGIGPEMRKIPILIPLESNARGGLVGKFGSHRLYSEPMSEKGIRNAIKL